MAPLLGRCSGNLLRQTEFFSVQLVLVLDLRVEGTPGSDLLELAAGQLQTPFAAADLEYPQHVAVAVAGDAGAAYEVDPADVDEILGS